MQVANSRSQIRREETKGFTEGGWRAANASPLQVGMFEMTQGGGGRGGGEEEVREKRERERDQLAEAHIRAAGRERRSVEVKQVTGMTKGGMWGQRVKVAGT